MDKKTAQTLIENTFNNAFSEEQFIRFSQELLNDIDFSHSRNWSTLIYEDFAGKISKYKRVGLYTDPEGNEVEVLIVEVENAQMLERARTSLRNFVIKWLQSDKNKSKSRDYGLVAFYAKDDNGNDWRFSFIKVEQASFMDEAKGKVKLKKEFTPAKRYSFLVGKYEKAYTAKNQLLPLLQNIANNPTVEELESAFSIEKVTDEFFNQYKDLYVKLYEHFENDSRVKAELNNAGIDNARFTKKLLGQIVFLYFLQKKGWLGVAQNERWGTGNKRFVQNLFEIAQTKKLNFFKDKLQYLFYEALAKQRDNENSYYKRFDCRIPFLNGGLFEGDITQISIPENLFRNEEKNKAGDVGTGILDVFDRYNFTIKEDEPLDKEVAVDPEMLGKVFENMLDIVERKSKGAFYTPREIVHYMCQESLIHYLDNCLNQDSQDSKINRIDKSDLETFIREGHFALENDERVAAKGETRTYQYQLPESIRQHADRIDQKLSDIKICDPAIGSGAFPVGLLHELVNAMLVLKPHLSLNYYTDKLKGFGFVHRESVNNSRYIYRLKRHIIQESIYGVDIDASAIDIARLRLWLSLVVDEDDLDPIETLPNLDYKIVCGNSLIGFPDGWNSPNFQKIETLKNEFYNETDETRKKELKHQIEEQIKDRLGSSKRVFGYDVNFDFKLFFSEVWHKKGGFDVVIGNPPYVEAKKLKNISSFLRNYEVYSGTADLSVYFIEKGINLTRKEGFLIYITTNKFFNTGYGKPVRNYITKKVVKHIIDFEQVEVFEKVLVSSVIAGIQNTSYKNENFTYEKFEKLKYLEFRQQFSEKKHSFGTYNQALLDDKEWAFSDKSQLKLKNAIESRGIKVVDLEGVEVFRGVTTGFNPAFIISTEQKDELIKADAKNKEVIKPLLQGRNIRKWKYNYNNENLVFIPWHFPLHLDGTISGSSEIAEQKLKQDYPSMYNHLLQYKDELSNRNKEETNIRYEWYALQRCAASYYPEFEKLEKIIWGLTADKWAFAYDDKQHFLPSNGYILASEKIPIKYILGLLNSNVLNYYFGFIGVMTAGGAYTLKHATIQQLPIVISKDQSTIVSIVDYILNLKRVDNEQVACNFFEAVLDSTIYELYFPSEIKSAGKEILKHLGDLKPINDGMSEEDKLAVIQSEFERLYDPNHPVRFAVETLDSVEEVRIIKEALK